jgi:hypothetical protein
LIPSKGLVDVSNLQTMLRLRGLGFFTAVLNLTDGGPFSHCGSVRMVEYFWNAGLAVADGGARIYIVGGRAGNELKVGHPCVGSDDTSTCQLAAEVFELNLGDDPLHPRPTAHWRQVRLTGNK